MNYHVCPGCGTKHFSKAWPVGPAPVHPLGGFACDVICQSLYQALIAKDTE